MLEPTKIYIKELLPAVQTGLVKGMSHITGGGFVENVPRMLPKGLGCYIDASAWQYPPLFKFLMKHGNVAPLEMARTFNNGIGMVLAVDEDVVAQVRQLIPGDVFEIGAVTAKSGVEMRNLDAWKS